MADDKTKQGRDRKSLAPGKEYEVPHFAEEHGPSMHEASPLIVRAGGSHQALDAAAREF